MGIVNQPTVVNFQKHQQDQSRNFGSFVCPCCKSFVTIEGAYWPGTPTIATIVRLHFTRCAHANANEILHFIVREMSSRMRPQWFVLDLSVPVNHLVKTPEEALRDATWKNVYQWVGKVALAASGLPLRFICAIEEPYPDVPELGGYPVYFRFTDGVELMVLEVPGDTPRTMAAKLLRKLLQLRSRPAA